MIAFLFPGQGSQYTGMGADFCAEFAVAKRTFEEASDALGIDLANLCFEGEAATLALTANAQPAILTTSVAALRVLLEETEIRPDLVAGHSLGEFTALVASECLGFSDAVRMVRKRGEFMQEAVPPGVGKMAAVLGLTSQEVNELCTEVAGGGAVVSPANFNSPTQTVISGEAGAVEAASELAREKGARRVVELEVSAPFHCSLMEPAAAQLRDFAAEIDFHPMKYPVITNTEAQANSDSARVADILVRQVVSPVRWAESLEFLKDSGVSEFIEIGPSKVLSGLVKRTLKGVSCAGIEKPDELNHIKADEIGTN
ncbi:MAG: ACP S-malonyltransferase [Candidatus Dadabacteria bacterium]|nr:ACP S-malonyltransferase [Candidatus Dadabacteria bacterium]MYA48803.1 ACP S-malonyltransferase [Candidatus Dadabacteria bacterium]MYF47479.1 ACP S-malonyltransferase [Candidatus Dadabacteria bacterium]MYG82343.1 ACP S-malonyltransferase [Candidatus Dadabacteria bacterium]MYK49862.1 ACP S-malonyltransferase [Candidatus Dadabacteria bacterium]